MAVLRVRGEMAEFYGKAENPHRGPNPGRTQGGSLDAVRALRPPRTGGHRRSVVPEMPPVPPLASPGKRPSRAKGRLRTSGSSKNDERDPPQVGVRISG